MSKDNNKKSQRVPEIKYTHIAIIIGILVAVCILFGFITDNFYTVANLTGMTRSFMEPAILAFPMTFIIISGCIDLSQGGTVAMCSILLVKFYELTGNIGLAVILTLIMGLVAGAVNGLFIGYVKIPPFIVTLATMFLYEGIAQGISEAETLTGLPESFYALGQGFILYLPVQFWIFVILAIIFAFVLNRTAYGRNIRAIGFNPESATFAGINVARTHLTNYMISGLMAALSAMILVARITAAKSNAGMGYETDAIIATVLGGTSIAGGYGNIEGTILGALLVGILRNGMTLARIPSEVTTIITGALLLSTIIISGNASKWFNKYKLRRS